MCTDFFLKNVPKVLHINCHELMDTRTGPKNRVSTQVEQFTRFIYIICQKKKVQNFPSWDKKVIQNLEHVIQDRNFF